MKKIIFLLLLLPALAGFSQRTKRPCMPDEGYWVVESNVNTPKESVVHFYTNTHVLVHSESVSGKKVNIKRKKTVRQLNAALHLSLLAFNRGGTLKEGGFLVQSKF